VTILSGCLRFVPAREQRSGSDLGTAEEFHSIEKREQDKLAGFLKQRTADRQPTSSSYVIGPGDLLELRVYGVPELSTNLRVRPEGTVSLPLLNELKVAGKTETDLEQELRRRLKEFLNDPQISLSVTQYEAQRVSIIGEVTKPGVYPLRRANYSLIDALSEAGGRTQRASTRLILIPAEAANGGAHAASGGIEIDIEDALGNNNKPPLLLPLRGGDTIVVHEAGTVEVDGEVNKPGAYPLSSRTSILGAIAAAGGFTYSADVKGVEVIRDVGNGRKAGLTLDVQKVALEQGQDVRLRNGDVIRVPSASGRFVTRQIVEVLNGIVNVGVSGTVK
jgi:polysaccharide biosynthesis/export protein